MARILIIEDEPAIGLILATVLADEGHETIRAANGVEGIETLERGPAPDVVMADLRMPLMNGREVVAAMRRRPEWADIPALILTGSVPAPDVLPPPGTYTRLLQKPFDLDDVVNAVREALEGHEYSGSGAGLAVAER